jgi:hypothetical protein
MKMKFILYKDKKEKRKPTAQKQVYGCPSPQLSLCSNKHAFLPARWHKVINMVKAATISVAKTINS